MRLLLTTIACLALLYSTVSAQAPANDPIATEMQRHNTEIARLLQREPFRFNAAEAPATTAPAAPPAAAPVQAFAGTTCNCAVTGICTCDPATCMCAACRNGQVRMAAMGVSQPAVVSVGAPVVTRSWVSTSATPWVNSPVYGTSYSYTGAGAYVPATFSLKQTASGSFAALSNTVDANGNRTILYSDDRQGRKLKRHTRRGVRQGVE